MAVKLGGVFLSCALGPVNYAGRCIQGSKVPLGLQELTAKGLWGALRLGIEQAARLAGVQPRDVEGLLPMVELRASLQRVAARQQLALKAWTLYAGQQGGLLEGIAELTLDGRAPDASECLARIAHKVHRDRPFSKPLQALADEIGRYQGLLVRCRGLLDDGGVLTRAYGRRRLGNALAIGLSLALVLTAAVVVLVLHGARARLDAALSSADPCAVSALPERDIDRGSNEQARLVTERLAACADLRARAEREVEAQRRSEEREAEAQRRRAALDAGCEALAAHLAEGRVTPEDGALSTDGGDLLRRIAEKKLRPSDLGPEAPALPCASAKAGDRVRAAFAEASLATVWTWVDAFDPSEATREALAARRDELPLRARLMIGRRAVDASKRAILAGNEEEMARAQRMCRFGEAVGAPTGQFCGAVKEMLGKKP